MASLSVLDFDIDEFYPKLPEHLYAYDSPQFVNDIRPRFLDGISKEWLLLDSGAQVTVVPKKMYPSAQPDMRSAIQAVNGARVQTYGKSPIKVRMGRKTYAHMAIVADVTEIIIGWDFARLKKISLIWADDGELELHDRKAGIIAKTRPAKVPHHMLDFAAVSTINIDSVSPVANETSHIF